MDRLTKRALAVLENVAQMQANATPASAARLAALIPAFKELPWDNIHTVRVKWDMIADDLVPTLEVVMKGDLP